ncbi:MAG: M64 family metallopeptidase [Adhaeribacter sp.]
MVYLHRNLLLMLLTACPFLEARGQKFEVDTVQYSGKTEEFINLVILGDGYTEEQLNKYLADARQFSNYLFNQAPYKAYKQYFNVFAIQVISPESGVKHPATAGDCYTDNFPKADPKNYFGTTFDVGGIHRLVVPSSFDLIASVLAESFPAYDQVVILANTSHYGGSGGQFATTTIHDSSNEIAVHEMGHSFGGLADEYWAGEFYAREKPNMTRENSPKQIKWRNWLGGDTGIGIYNHSQTKWNKPSQNACKMEFLFRPHCAVCAETIVEQIHNLARPIGMPPPKEPEPIRVNPQTRDFYVRLQAVKPSPNTLKTTWQLNGVSLAANQDSVLIMPAKLGDGTNSLLVTVQDTTPASRSDLHKTSHVYVGKWIFENAFALPVEWKDFKARGHAAGVSLSWTTASEVNNVGFAVERSSNGRDWQQIGTLPGQGNSRELRHYQWEDHGPFPLLPATLYYRLQQKDLDGQVNYSRLEAVDLQPLARQLRLLRNPVGRQLQFRYQGPGPGLLLLAIYRPDGSQVLHLPVMAIGNEIKVPVAHLAPGFYIYSLFENHKKVLTGKFLKEAD